jgi:capsular exopolysaccharide synthesis family protein
MLTGEHNSATLLDYFAILRRRAVVIVAMTVLVAGVAYLLALQETKVYRASAEVLLNRQDLGSAVTGTPDPTLSSDPQRVAETQVGIARLPEVASRALTIAGVDDRSAYDLLGSSAVHSNVDSDILGFSVDDHDPQTAAKLATAYAQAFTDVSRGLATATLKKARLELQRRLGSFKTAADRSSPIYRSMADQVQALETMELLQNPGTLVRPAGGAAKVKPTPKRNGLIGAVFGLLLGCGFAFVLEAVDKRIRSEREIEERLGLPLLSRLPVPAKHRGEPNRLAMMTDLISADAESIRKLRVHFEFANLDLHARAILITSAVQQEGKSTTIANLALALARAGHTVALVDLDLRQPALTRLFEIKSTLGLTDVTLGRAQLEQVMVPVQLSRSVVAPMTNGCRTNAGALSILPTGVLPANPGEFVGTEALARVIADLRMRYEYVLVDAPPMCALGDAMALSTRMDALIVVTRLGTVDRRTLDELSRELHAISAPKLGFVLTGVPRMAGYGEYYRYDPTNVELHDRPRQGRSTASL